MPVENRFLIQVIAIVVPIVISIIVSSVLLFEKIARNEERITVIRSQIVGIRGDIGGILDKTNNHSSLINRVGHLERRIEKVGDKCEREFSSMTNRIYNARKYVRDQIEIFDSKVDNVIMGHIMNSDLHSEKIKIEKTR